MYQLHLIVKVLQHFKRLLVPASGRFEGYLAEMRGRFSFSFPMLRIFRIVRSVRLSKTSSRVSKSSLDFILTRRSRSYLSSRFLSFSSTLSDREFTQRRDNELTCKGAWVGDRG